MSKPLAFLVAIGLTVALSAGCANDVSPGLQVGAAKISNDDVLAEVAEWAGNPAAVPADSLVGQAPGTLPQALVAQILEQRIDLELHRQEFEALGLELSDELRSEAILALFGDQATADEALGGFSKAFAARYVDDVVRQNEVQTALADGYTDWRDAALQEAKVTVNPRYGTWDPESGTIIPPDGPVDPASTDQLQLGGV